MNDRHAFPGAQRQGLDIRLGLRQRRPGPRQLQLRRLHELHLQPLDLERDRAGPRALVQRGLQLDAGDDLQQRGGRGAADSHHRPPPLLHQQPHRHQRLGPAGGRDLRAGPRGQPRPDLEGHAAHRRQDGAAAAPHRAGLADERRGQERLAQLRVRADGRARHGEAGEGLGRRPRAAQMRGAGAARAEVSLSWGSRTRANLVCFVQADPRQERRGPAAASEGVRGRGGFGTRPGEAHGPFAAQGRPSHSADVADGHEGHAAGATVKAIFSKTRLELPVK